jgi:hypothetical protein
MWPPGAGLWEVRHTGAGLREVRHTGASLWEVRHASASLWEERHAGAILWKARELGAGKAEVGAGEGAAPAGTLRVRLAQRVQHFNRHGRLRL